jgi:hypothetical protein
MVEVVYPRKVVDLLCIAWKLKINDPIHPYAKQQRQKTQEVQSL